MRARVGGELPAEVVVGEREDLLRRHVEEARRYLHGEVVLVDVEAPEVRKALEDVGDAAFEKVLVEVEPLEPGKVPERRRDATAKRVMAETEDGEVLLLETQYFLNIDQGINILLRWRN